MIPFKITRLTSIRRSPFPIVLPVIAYLLMASIFVRCRDNTNAPKVDSTSTMPSITNRAEPFALVELFTSEGCADCPPAERYANRLAKSAWADRSYVYVLSFHVDYWNKLGWPDPFSHSSYSDRQRSYRRSLGNEVVYTPQVVLNGVEDYVGSDSLSIDSAIQERLKVQPSLYFTVTPNENWSEVRLEVVSIDSHRLSDSADLTTHVAVVERGLQTQVPRGENAGKTLMHENVVVQFTSHGFEPAGQVLSLPGVDSLSSNHSLVVFVQNQETMSVEGANIWNF